MEVLHFHMTRFFVRDDITDSRFIIKSKRFNSMSSHREATLQGHTKNFEIVASNIIHYYCEVALIEASSLKLRTTDISKMWKRGNWKFFGESMGKEFYLHLIIFWGLVIPCLSQYDIKLCLVVLVSQWWHRFSSCFPANFWILRLELKVPLLIISTFLMNKIL